MSLEDLCTAIAKIRMVADLVDIDHYGVKYEYDYVEIPGQSIVGMRSTLLEVADEIEKAVQDEIDKWSN